MSEAAYDASVVIVTKERQADGLKAVASAFAQADRVEVIVIDDGSGDGTSAAIAERFPVSAAPVPPRPLAGYSLCLSGQVSRSPVRPAAYRL
jgi:GT2 family glycosyltransferase